MEIFAILVVGGAVLGGVLLHARRQHAAWQAECATLADVEDTSAFMALALRTRPPLRAAAIAAAGGAAGGGKNNPPVWRATSTSKVGARTSLTLSREGALGGLREKIGVKDVHTGDASFDAGFTVRGSEPDVVRGILHAPSARDAVRRFFATGGATMVNIESNAAASASFPRSGTSAANARVFALALAQLLDALDEVADAPARAQLDGASSVGGASGSPVRVPSS